MTEQDQLLRRIERRAFILTAVVVAVVLGWSRGDLRMAGAVLGGALLSGVSYWAIKSGVTGIADAIVRRGGGGRPTARGFVLFVLRYALLAVLAYVMIARLRLSPLGLLGGASVIPASAMIEILRRQT